MGKRLYIFATGSSVDDSSDVPGSPSKIQAALQAGGGGATIGGSVGSVVPVIGSTVGSIAGGIGGAIVGIFRGGKRKKTRENIKDMLVAALGGKARKDSRGAVRISGAFNPLDVAALVIKLCDALQSEQEGDDVDDVRGFKQSLRIAPTKPSDDKGLICYFDTIQPKTDPKNPPKTDDSKTTKPDANRQPMQAAFGILAAIIILGTVFRSG